MSKNLLAIAQQLQGLTFSEFMSIANYFDSAVSDLGDDEVSPQEMAIILLGWSEYTIEENT